MKTNKIVLLSLVALSVGALASCGGRGENSPFKPFEGDPKELTATVTFWHTIAKDRQADWLVPLIENFNKTYPNIKIDHVGQGGYNDVKTKVMQAIPAGTTPTMAFCYPDHVAEYINAGVSEDMTPYFTDPKIGFTEEDAQDDLDPIFLKEGGEYNVEGYYSMPFAKSAEAVFFNQKYFNEKGYTVPTYWENPNDPNDVNSMIGLARKIKKEEEAANPGKIYTPIGYDSDANMIISLFEAYGIPYTKIVPPDADPNLAESNPFLFENAEAKALVSKIAGWVKEGILCTQGTLPNSAHANTKLTAGEAFMVIGSTGGVKYNVSNGAAPNIQFITDVAEVPGVKVGDEIKKAVISQGPSVTFFSSASQEERYAAWLFYRAMTDTLGTTAYSVGTGYQPVRKSAYETDAYKNYADVTKTNPTNDFEDNTENLNFCKAKTAAITPNYTKNSNYFVSPAFKGSATAREQMDGLIAAITLRGETVDAAFASAMKACILTQDID